jgi:hypothetical protein
MLLLDKGKKMDSIKLQRWHVAGCYYVCETWLVAISEDQILIHTENMEMIRIQYMDLIERKWQDKKNSKMGNTVL